MEAAAVTQSSFGIVTFIAAPALLTNASSVLAMSTINRMLATRELMHKLYTQSEMGKLSENEAAELIKKADRVEKQAELLFRALRSIYLALASFVCATLVTLLGAVFASLHNAVLLDLLVGIGVAIGFIGVAGLVTGCVRLFRATQLSLLNIHDEAASIRTRQAPRKEPD
jgi:hypothetical protein